MPPASKKKKVGKERLDKYYHLAKSQGYRARSAFKLIQLNKKFGFLNNARVAIDLCAAPGGWLQVCQKYMPMSSIIIGVDLVKIKPIPKVITHVEDITSDRCRTLLKKDLKDWKADLVMNDGAPNVGTAWVQDAFTQSELVLAALRLATEFLAAGGTFVTKVFRSQDYNNLMFVFNQLFRQVEATKPPSSRNVSAEIFVVCRGYLAPKKIDPRFLDGKYVFRDVDLLAGDGDQQDPSVTAGVAKVSMQDLLNPEKAAKRRHRDGYKDGDYTLHNKIPVLQFIESPSEAEATVFLAQSHEFSWDPRPESTVDDLQKIELIKKHSSTDAEMLECMVDLKVLGRREYKAILKWRKQMRKHVGLDAGGKSSREEEEEASPIDEKQPPAIQFNEEAVVEQLEELSKEQSRAEKRVERKRRQKMARDRTRLQLNMIAPTDIALDDSIGDSIFAKDISIGDELDQFADSSDGTVSDDGGSNVDSDEEMDSDLEKATRLEKEVDSAYSDYLNRREERIAQLKVQAMRAAETEFRGADENNSSSDDDEDGSDQDDNEALQSVVHTSNSESETDEEIDQKQPIKGDRKPEASMWFKNPVFDGMDLSDEENGELPSESRSNPGAGAAASEDRDFVVEKLAVDNRQMNASAKAFELMTNAEAVDLAMRMVQDGGRSKRDLLDERGYNRYTFNDGDGNLPNWFVADENKHNRPQRPISKEAVQLLRQRQKEIDSRPIKKVMEAKARKKYKANKKLESLRQKMNDLVEADGPDDPEAMGKLSQVDKTMKRALAKAKKAEQKKPKLVVARGGNRAVKGRPKGTKGRYKMVDSRLKKDKRGEKRRK